MMGETLIAIGEYLIYFFNLLRMKFIPSYKKISKEDFNQRIDRADEFIKNEHAIRVIVL